MEKGKMKEKYKDIAIKELVKANRKLRGRVKDMEEKITLQDIGKIPLLTDRERLEAYLAVTYAREFNHGTDGHTRLALCAKLIKNYLALLELNARLESQLVELVKEGK